MKETQKVKKSRNARIQADPNGAKKQQMRFLFQWSLTLTTESNFFWGEGIIHPYSRKKQPTLQRRQVCNAFSTVLFVPTLLNIMKLKTFTQAQSIGMNATGLSISFFNNFWSYTLLKLQFIDQSVSKSHQHWATLCIGFRLLTRYFTINH